MDINFTVTYTAHFDLEQAKQDFFDRLYWDPELDIDELLYDTVEENIIWFKHIDELPNEVIETAVNTLRHAIGGIQLRMELD